MKQYPSISSFIQRRISVNVYDKIDGSNIRVEWTKKRGFHKFGSRKQLLAGDQGLISKAPSLLLAYTERLENYLTTCLHAERAIVYFEFYGENSFAGSHEIADNHKLVVLDIELYKRGFIHQDEYLRMAQNYDIPIPYFIGKHIIDHDFEEMIRNGKIGSFEGVVCKSIHARDKHGKPIMFKIKNQAWIDKVKAKFANNPAMLKQLL